MGHSSWSNDNPRRIVVVVGTAYSGLFFYDPEPAAGTLIGSWSAAAGTDPYGNNYPQGLRVGTVGDPAVVLGYSGTSGYLYFPGIVPNVSIDAHLQLNHQGAGTGQVSFLTIGSAIDSTQNDSSFVNLFASSKDGTQNTHVTLTYQDPTSVVHSYVVVSLAGAVITGKITAVDPATGLTRANPAAAESWHTLALGAGFSGGVAGTATPRYQLEGVNGGRTRLSGGVSLTANQAQSTVIATLPAAYRPTSDLFINTANNLSGGATNVESLHIDTGGNIRLGVAGSNGNYVMLDNITFPLD